MAATLLCDSIRKHFGKKKLVGVVFMDLTQAFDTVNHGKLIDKLQMYDINRGELDWFTDYLFHRTQFVDINGTYSNEEPLLTGVPQGTILGPLLFVIFNDFAEILQHSEVIQYADDTVIFVADSNVNEISKLLNEDLNNVSDSCFENELLLNHKKDKTEAMLFCATQRLSKAENALKLFYRGDPVQNTEHNIYLGNIVDPSLTLNADFDHKYKKVTKRLRLLSLLNSLAAEKIYNTMIMTYCSQLRVCMTATQINRLNSISLRATKLINNPTLIVTNVEKLMSVKLACLYEGA